MASSTSWVTNRMVLAVSDPDAEQQFLHVAAGLGVEGAEGLVHEDDAGAERQRAGDGHALLHAAGERIGVGLLEPGQAGLLDQAGDGLVRARPGGTPLIFIPYSTFCATVSQGKEVYFWKTMPRSRPGPVTGLPFTSTSPVSGWSRPAIRRRMVDLPQPDGPSRTRNSPMSRAVGREERLRPRS